MFSPLLSYPVPSQVSRCSWFSVIFIEFRLFFAVFRRFLPIFIDFRSFSTIFDHFWKNQPKVHFHPRPLPPTQILGDSRGQNGCPQKICQKFHFYPLSPTPTQILGASRGKNGCPQKIYQKFH